MAGHFWTMWNYGGAYQVCSTHQTLTAAQKAADKCEANGGAKHDIIYARRQRRRLESRRRRRGAKRVRRSTL